ncbi:MAG: helix-turn-helix domain-containing protein [Pseudomonadota bacterium]
MENTTNPSIDTRIAANLRELRAERGLSLEALAQTTGVSRSALSLIERGHNSPTAVVLDKIAVGLGVTLSDLVGQGGGSQAGASAATPLARHAEQAIWTDPGSGYVRRALSPPGFPSPIQLVEVVFPAGARVAFETGPRNTRVHQQVWVLDGAMDLIVGESTWQLQRGDCLAMMLDQPIIFHNPTDSTTRYAVVLVSETPSTRKF